MTRQLAVGAFSPSVLLRVARRLGTLDGLDVRETPVPSSPAQLRALLDGDLDAAFTSPDNVVAYRFVPDNPLGETADVRIVAAIDRGLGLGVYGMPGCRLKGARIGVDVPGSGFAFALYAALESLGLARGDYNVVTLGSTPRRLDALLSGDCDATMLNAGSDLRAEAAGAVRLVRLTDVCRPYLGTVLCTVGRRETALAAALREAAREIAQGRADRLVVEEASAALGLPDDLAWRYLVRLRDPDEGLVADGTVDLAAMETVVGLRRRYAPAPLDDVLDPSRGLIDMA
jgi:ABC-type nitrate/sulfonate/bicarbonate transport system substrate-binding protein